MILKLPIDTTSWTASLTRWAAEIRAAAIAFVADFIFKDWAIAVSSVMTISTVTIRTARVLQIGDLVIFYTAFSFTTVAAANPVVSFTAPVTPKDLLNGGGAFSVALTDVAGTTLSGSAVLNGSNIDVRRFDGLNWGIGAGRDVRCLGVYETN